jgi:hypothetical protein
MFILTIKGSFSVIAAPPLEGERERESPLFGRQASLSVGGALSVVTADEIHLSWLNRYVHEQCIE